jgi:heptosyltransferase I
MINGSKIKSLALFRLSAIGDVVMMVPVIRSLQDTYPNIKITWITSPMAHQLLDGLSGVDFLVIDKPTSLSTYLDCRTQLRPYKFDVLLAAQASLRANLIYPLIKAPIKIGFDKVRSRDAHGLFVNRRVDFAKEHLLDGFMRFSQYLGVDTKTPRWDMPIDAVHHAFAAQQLSIKEGPWLAINPMASKRERDWFVDRYVDVIDQAVARWGVNVVLTGGPGDTEKAFSQSIADRTKADCLVLTGQTNLKQLAALLAAVDVLLAPDTGPVHIATAMGTKVIGLYAVAPSLLSGPYCSKDWVIDKYPQAVEKFLKEDPASVAWGTRVHTQDAMGLITVDDVIGKLGEVF